MPISSGSSLPSRRPWGRSGGVCRRAQPELRGDRLEGGHDVRDVLVELEPDELGTPVDLVAVHTRRERRLLELLPDRLRLETVQTGRSHEPTGVDEARELVTREQRLHQLGLTRDREVLGVREHGLDQPFGIPLLAQDRRAVLGMLVERGVDLVVEVVEKRSAAPRFLVLASQPRVVPHRRLDGERVAKERLARRVTRQRLPGLVAGHVHGVGTIPPRMQSFVIEGGHPLQGVVRAAGNKNGALPILAATVLATEPVQLSNVPRIEDVETMVELLQDIGAAAEWTGENEVRIDSSGVHKTDLDPELCRRIRASFLLAGPLLARFGRATVPPPGGDVIGRRRLDTHIHAFAELGVDWSVNGAYELSTKRLVGKRMFLDEASVMGTENAVMAAVLAEGATVVGHAACEPHIQDLCRFLVALGARIEGIGSNILHIEGVDTLGGGDYRIGPDHVEVASFAALAAATGGEVVIEDVVADDLISIVPAFRKLGIALEVGETSLRVPPGQDLHVDDDLGGQIPKIESGIWPAFPADLTSIAVTVATQARGTVLIFEKMFESRLFFVDKLVGMGAKIILCDPHRAVVSGPTKLYGERLESPDIRAGMAMVIAALCAEGRSTIGNVRQIDRGYERIDERLRAIGASIERAEL